MFSTKFNAVVRRASGSVYPIGSHVEGLGQDSFASTIGSGLPSGPRVILKDKANSFQKRLTDRSSTHSENTEAETKTNRHQLDSCTSETEDVILM